MVTRRFISAIFSRASQRTVSQIRQKFALLKSKGNFADSETARFQLLSTTIGRFFSDRRRLINCNDSEKDRHGISTTEARGDYTVWPPSIPKRDHTPAPHANFRRDGRVFRDEGGINLFTCDPPPRQPTPTQQPLLLAVPVPLSKPRGSHLR